MVGVDDSLPLRGHMLLRVYEDCPWAYPFMSNYTLAETLKYEEPVETREAHNILCNNGLNVLLNALVWSSVNDQAANMGSVLPYTDMTALYGALGTGTVSNGTSSNPPAQTDSTLITEYERGVVIASGTTNAFSTFNPSLSWLFLLPASGISTTITEAGVFVNATSAINDGSPLLDHAIISPSVVQGVSQLVTLLVTITIGN